MKKIICFVAFLIFVLSSNFSAFGVEDDNALVKKLVTNYYKALQEQNYQQAFSYLAPPIQKVYRSSKNLANIYHSHKITVKSFKIKKIELQKEKDVTKALATVSIERKALNFKKNKIETIEGEMNLPLVKVNNKWRVFPIVNQWKSYQVGVSGEKNKLKVTVNLVEMHTNYTIIYLTFKNSGEKPVTIFPHRTSMIKDNLGIDYKVIDSPVVGTDEEMYVGKVLRKGQEVRGYLVFRGKIIEKASYFTVVVTNNLIIGSQQDPFSIEISPISIPK